MGGWGIQTMKLLTGGAYTVFGGVACLQRLGDQPKRLRKLPEEGYFFLFDHSKYVISV